MYVIMYVIMYAFMYVFIYVIMQEYVFYKKVCKSAFVFLFS